MSEIIVLGVFVAAYLGMAVGRVPGLRMGRAAILFVAVAVLLATGAVDVERMGAYIDMPTLLLLFGLMILSGQFGVAGFYDWCAARLAFADLSPRALLASVVIVAAGLSAILANDIVVFAMAPILCTGAQRRGLDPRPFLIALAAASNGGSAATLIGNPQNILIGQVGGLDFWEFLLACAGPALVASALVYVVVARIWRGALDARPARAAAPDIPPPDRIQTAKALLATVGLIALFATPIPREVAALLIAAALLVSRRIESRRILDSVDWHLLMLFVCLFIVTGSLADIDLAARSMAWFEGHGLIPDSLALMAPLSLVASNLIGNVPTVMLILKLWPGAPDGALYGLAALSTLAGNMLLLGSLANIIVVERAASVGVRLSFLEHAKCGFPITILSMAGAVAWLGLAGWMPWR